jgi:cytosine deaminase
MLDMVIKNVRLFPDTTQTRDIAVSGSQFAEMAARITQPARVIIDAAGDIAVPGFVDAHTHLDKALLMDRIPNTSGTLKEAIINTNAYLKTASVDDFIARGSAALRMALANGTTYLRTHVSINPDLGLTAFHATLKLKAMFADRLRLDIVAFPSAHRQPLTGSYLELVETALASGADTLGGCPNLMPDHAAFIDTLFELAARHACPIDCHVDESDDPDVRALEYLADATMRLGWQGKVTAGHCTALAVVDDATAARVIAKVRAADITIVTLPSANLFLMGRATGHPKRRGTTRIDELLASGVNVAAASDNLRDPFRPFGNFDLTEEALLTGQLAQMGKPADFPVLLSMISYNAAKALGLNDYGFRPGYPATLTLLASQSVTEAIIGRPAKRLVMQAGLVNGGNTVHQQTSR